MCGQSGVISSYLTTPEITAFKELMFLSTSRGRDGAGCVVVPKDKNKAFKIIKTDDTALDLAVGQKLHDATKDQVSVLMGHARYPTTGGRGHQAIHPHLQDHIIGMHNGTMESVCGEAVSAKKNDSEMLFRAIAKYGAEEAIKNSRGAYSLVWIDRKAETINFLRNDQRPLLFAYPPGNGTYFWSSERRMLEYALGHSQPAFKYVYLRADLLLTLRLHNPGGTIGVISQTVVKSLPAIVPNLPAVIVPPIVPPNEKNNTAHVKLVEDYLESEYDVDGVAATYQTFGRHMVPFRDLETLLNKGCLNCGTPADWPDYIAKKIKWSKPDEFICDICYDHDPVAKAAYLSMVPGGQHV